MLQQHLQPPLKRSVLNHTQNIADCQQHHTCYDVRCQSKRGDVQKFVIIQWSAAVPGCPTDLCIGQLPTLQRGSTSCDFFAGLWETLYLGDVVVQLSNQVNIPGQPLRGANLVVVVDLGY